jgi:nucleolar MIF4G domain-containing protein 1
MPPFHRRGKWRKGKPGPTLPKELLEEIKLHKGESGASHSKLLSRKEQRKEKRSMKKQNKAEYFSKSTSEKPTLTSEFKSSKRPLPEDDSSENSDSPSSKKRVRFSSSLGDSSNDVYHKPLTLSSTSTLRANMNSLPASARARLSQSRLSSYDLDEAEEEGEDDEGEYSSDESSEIEDDIAEVDIQEHGKLLKSLLTSQADENPDEKMIRDLERKLGVSGSSRLGGGKKSSRGKEDDEDEEEQEDEDGAGKGGSSVMSKRSKRELSRLKNEYAEDGLGDDFVDFLSSLDDIIYENEDDGGEEAHERSKSAAGAAKSAQERRKELAKSLYTPKEDGEEEEDEEEEDEEEEDEENDGEVDDDDDDDQVDDDDGEVDSEDSDEHDLDDEEDEEEEEEEDDGDDDEELSEEEELEASVDDNHRPHSSTSSKGPVSGSVNVPAHVDLTTPESLALRKQLQGLMNRLGESNLEPISKEISNIYSNNSKRSVNALFWEILLASCKSHVTTLRPFVMTYGALLSALHILVGPEVGSFMLEQATNTFLQSVKLESQVSSDLSLSVDSADLKLPNNLLLLLSYLFVFGVSFSTIIVDLLLLLVKRYSESDVELLLLALTQVGFQLRSDDPVSLKHILMEVQEKSSSLDSLSSSRSRVLGEFILDLKNNRKRVEQEALHERTTQLRKWLSHLASKTSGNASTSDRRLRISLSDIRSIPERGRWWLVGSAWAGSASGLLPHGSSTPNIGGSARDESTLPASFNSKRDLELIPIAKAMRMNTPVRVSIFVAIMGASDVEDGFHRIMKLNLRGSVERDIVKVLLECACQEGAYNPFYSHILKRLCNYHSRFKYTLQLSLWDTIETLDQNRDSNGTSVSRRIKTINLAKLIAYLLHHKVVTMNIFQKVEFLKLSSMPYTLTCMKIAICGVILSLENTEEDLIIVFSKLGKNSSTKLLLRDAMLVFFHSYISVPLLEQVLKEKLNGKRIVKDVWAPEALKKQLKFIVKVLESISADQEEEEDF